MTRMQAALVLALAATRAVAGPLSARQYDSAATPWPAIPEPEKYSEPTERVRAYPVSVAKGLTTKHDNAVMRFDSVGDLYTRCVLRPLAQAQRTI